MLWITSWLYTCCNSWLIQATTPQPTPHPQLHHTHLQLHHSLSTTHVLASPSVSLSPALCLGQLLASHGGIAVQLWRCMGDFQTCRNWSENGGIGRISTVGNHDTRTQGGGHHPGVFTVMELRERWFCVWEGVFLCVGAAVEWCACGSTALAFYTMCDRRCDGWTVLPSAT